MFYHGSLDFNNIPILLLLKAVIYLRGGLYSIPRENMPVLLNSLLYPLQAVNYQRQRLIVMHKTNIISCLHR